MGIVEAMMRSVRDNRNLRGETRRMSDRNDEFSYERSKPLRFNDTMSKEDHQIHQAKWKARKRQTQIKMGLVLFSMTALVLMWIFWLAR